MKLEAGKFYGKTSQKLLAENFSFTEKSYSVDTNIPSHSHELAHFCFVLTGNYSEKIGKTNFERKSAALVYYPPDVSHAESHYTNGKHFLIEINNEGLNKIRDYGVKLDNHVILKNENSLLLANRLYQEFIYQDKFSALALESITTELLIDTSRKTRKKKKNHPPKWLNDVKEFLNEKYFETVGLNELSKVAEVHPTHLARVFRQFENCTAGDYVRKIRVNKACQLLIYSKKSLVEIALETGFSDQPHFTRSFKAIIGLTPREYRKTFKRN